MTSPADPARGLQAERTALAWRRTALALSVACLGTARLAVPALGVVAVLLGAAGAVLAALVAPVLRPGPGGARRTGVHVAATATAGAVLAVLALGVVVGVRPR